MTASLRRPAITAFFAVFFGGQIALVSASHMRGDKLFGYQMFAETTYFHATLHRVTVDGSRVPAPHGAWTAKGRDGRRRQFRWQSQVRDFKLDVLERRQRAKISIATTLKFFRLALAHVAANLPDDAETVRLELDVRYWTADGQTHNVTLASPDRRP